jgi:hypothetical protein
MGKKQAAAPPPVDYNAQAQAQGVANVEAARTSAALNRVNQFTPYGSLVYTQGATPDQWESTVTLSPEQQALLDKQTQGEQVLADTANAGLGRVQNAFSQPFSTSGAPSRVTSVGTPTYDMYTGQTNLPNSGIGGNFQTKLDFSSLQNVPGGNDFAAQKDEVRDALYRQATSQLDPQFQQEEDALRTRLANQGIAQGTEAYTNALNDYYRNRTAAYGDARDRALLGAGAEQSRLNADALASRSQMLQQILSGGEFANQASLTKADFENTVGQQNIDNKLTALGFNNTTRAQQLSDAIASGNFQNQARGSYLDEQAYLRNLPLNEYNALISGSQVTNPAFANTPQVNGPAPAPVFAGAQAQNQSALDLYNSQIAQNNSNTQAATGLIGAGVTAAAIF